MVVDCQLGDGQTFAPIDRRQLNRRGVALAPSA
jgi:hypothetical protein